MSATVPMPATATPRRFSSLVPWLVFALSITMTIGVYQYLLHQKSLERKAWIAREAAQISAEIRDRLRSHAQFLRGVRAHMASSGDVTRSEWKAFSSLLDIERNISGIQLYGYAPKQSSGKDGAQRFPVEFLTPENPANRPVLGFDLNSEARRAEAIRYAVESNEVSLSRRIELLRDHDQTERKAALFMVLPVYRADMPTNTVTERHAALNGVVYALYRIDDFMSALNYANSNTLKLRIFDDESFNTDAAEQFLTLLFDNSDARAAPVDERELEFGRRNWHLHFLEGTQTTTGNEPLIFLVAGLLVSVLLGLASRLQVSAKFRAEELARSITHQLQNSEERFRLAAAGTNDGIYDRNLLDGTVWHSDRLNELAGFDPRSSTPNADLFLSRVHPDDRVRLDAALQQHFREHTPHSIEYRFQKASGEWAWFRSRGQAVWDDKGNPVRFVGAITDITEHKRDQEALAHYRDFLSTVLRFIPHPVFVKNRRREYIAVNQAFCHLLDRNESEIIGHINLGRSPMPSAITEQIRLADERVFAGQGEQIDEHALPLRRGLCTVVSRKALATDPDGEPILIGTLTDITDLRAAEKARAEAAAQLQAVLDAATEVSIIATDEQGLIKLFNRGAEKMLGYRADEMVGINTPAVIHHLDEVVVRGEFLTAELGHPVAGFEVFVALPRLYGVERRDWTYVRKDGTHLRVALVVTALRDSGGRLTGFLGIATDITEREQAQSELERQHARIQTILEHIPGGVSLIDSDMHFIAANNELLRILDFPAELFAAGPPPLYDVLLFNARRGEYGPGNPEEIAAAGMERARHPEKHKFERTRPNGRTLEVSGTPLPDGGFVTIYTDVTERRLAEAELLRHRDNLQELVDERTKDVVRAKEAAERASEAKSEFLANMSHELRTPMHSILSFARLGEEKASAAAQEKLRHFFQRIHQSGDRLLGLLNNLLDLSKLEAGMMHLSLAPVNLRELCRDLVTECEHWADQRGIRIELATGQEEPVAYVDQVRLGQVVRNLLSNAIKFSPEGGRISVAIEEATLPRGRRSTDSGPTAAFSIVVSDEGVGVPEDELETIFDKFVQSSKTKSGAGGTGLGLSISREIVRAHRGTIRACNNPVRGVSLIVTLPRHEPDIR